jgi:hypothetical protein
MVQCLSFESLPRCFFGSLCPSPIFFFHFHLAMPHGIMGGCCDMAVDILSTLGSLFSFTSPLVDHLGVLGARRLSTAVPLQKGSLTRDTPSIGDAGWLAAFALLVSTSYHQAADVDYTNNQTGLFSGSALARVHQEIALGVYSLASPTPLQVALWGPCRAFPAINEWHVAIALSWPWWSLEGFACMPYRIGHSPEKEVLVLTPQLGRV